MLQWASILPRTSPAMHTPTMHAPLPCMPPYHACPTAMHAPCHACPPLPCRPPTMHDPCHTCTPPCMSPSCGQNDRRLWKYNLSATTVGYTMPNSEEIQCKGDWVPLTTSKKMQKKLFIINGCSLQPIVLNIVVNYLDAKKSARYSQVLVVTEFIVRRWSVDLLIEQKSLPSLCLPRVLTPHDTGPRPAGDSPLLSVPESMFTRHYSPKTR